jgi:aldose 1-epimerase
VPEASASRSGAERHAPVDVVTLRNANGLEARVASIGGALLSLTAPDRNGVLADVVLGLDDPEAYRTDRRYLGVIVGRYANRIGGARFSLDGVEHVLAANEGANQLHGGAGGFSHVVWAMARFEDKEGPGVVLRYASADGEEGFPGALAVRASYQLTHANEWVVTLSAVTTAATPVNLSTHSYFNLSGDFSRDILDHELTIRAGRYTPVDAAMIPTGELRSVDGGPFDFHTPARIGARIEADDEQLRLAQGYDHNWALDAEADPRRGLREAAVLHDPGSGRALRVLTTEPGLQVYTGNHLDGRSGGKGVLFPRRAGVCLETQHFPDSPNQPQFPSTILRPGEVFASQTKFVFETR